MPSRKDLVLGKILGKDPRMIRFYAIRMVIELAMGRQLDPVEQRRIYEESKVGVLERATQPRRPP